MAPTRKSSSPPESVNSPLAEVQALAHVGSFEWDLQTHELNGSAEMFEIFGWDPGDVESAIPYEKYSQSLHPDDRAAVTERVGKAIQARKTYVFEHRITRPNGEIRTVVARGRVISDLQGSALRFVGTLQDVTDRKRIEEELVRAKQELERLVHERTAELGKSARLNERLIENSRDCILVLDLEGHLLSMNAGGLQLFGAKTFAPFRGKSWIDFWLGADRTHAIAAIAAAKAGQTGRLVGYAPTLDGAPKWWDVMVTLLTDEDGNPEYLLCTSRDITGFKTSERTLRAAIQARDEFLSIASHELKTPLTTLKLQTQIRLRDIENNDLPKFAMDRMERMFKADDRQIIRLSRLIDDMLDVSRINTGKLAMETTEFDLVELVRDVVDNFDIHGVQVAIGGEKEVRGRWDYHRLEQVVVNLLTNAAKYGGGSSITLRLSRLRDGVELRVEDRGTGIPREDHERIFHRFERAVKASEVSGLGLGLYIVKQIVDAHGGTIRVESEVGEGANFIVELPYRVPQPDGRGTAAPESGQETSLQERLN